VVASLRPGKQRPTFFIRFLGAFYFSPETLRASANFARLLPGLRPLFLP